MSTGKLLAILTHDQDVINKLTFHNRLYKFLVCLLLDKFHKHDGDKTP